MTGPEREKLSKMPGWCVSDPACRGSGEMLILYGLCAGLVIPARKESLSCASGLIVIHLNLLCQSCRSKEADELRAIIASE